MAFAGSIAPHRKTTTYGRHSRRLMPSLSSATQNEFAQGAGASISGPEVLNLHWQGYGRNESSNMLHRHNEVEPQSERLACQEPYPRPMSKNQLRSSPGRSDFTKDDSLYEVPPSDEEFVYNANAARKRRKISSSKVVTDQKSLVYDDESLQRHIAAEARRGEGQILHSPDTTWVAQDSVVNDQATARRSPRTGMIETTKDSSLDHTHKGINATATKQIKGHLVARNQSKALLRDDFASHRMQKTRIDPAKIDARPTTPDTVFDRVYTQEGAGGSRGLTTSSKSVYQPTTPPRSISATGRATTPRQRELWNKLLVNDAQVVGISSMDLPGHIIGVKTHENLGGRAKSRSFPLGLRQQPSMLNARSKRIVDTLHQSDQDQEHSSDGYDEMLGSSSSDNKSECTHSEPSAADGATTVQTSPSADSQGLVSQSHNYSSNASQTIPLLYGGCPKVTYARQRSYLTETDLEEAAMIGLPVTPESKKRGYERRRLEDSTTRTQSTKCLGEDPGNLADSQGGTMRSIHELREAGGNVRLASELEAILDDIGDYQSGSTSLRRSRLIDLVTKFGEPANCRRFVDQGLESRLVANVRLGNDVITDALLVAALFQLMSFSSSTPLLKQVGDVQVVNFLIDLLGSDQDLLSHARLRGNNMSKAAFADLKNLCSALLRSTAWRAGKPSVLSCHVLSLQCLEYFVRQTREAGSLSEVLSAHAIRRIVDTSIPPFPTPLPQPDAISIVSLELAVSILESCTISNAAECQASMWAGETLKRVIGLLPLLYLWKEGNCGTSRTLTLRLYLNLTNNSPGLCEDFSNPEVISVMFRIVISHFRQLASSALELDKALLLDDLILTLGSLINLADLSKLARQLVINLHYGGQSYLDILLELFMNKSENAAEVSSLEETSSNVAFGWMSVLLSWLCLEPAIKARVSEHLPGNSLKQLLDAVEEFLRYHRRVDQAILREGGEDDARATFIGRLQSHVDDLKRIEGLSEKIPEIKDVGKL